MPRKEKREPDFPNLKRIEEIDQELHAERGLEAGLTIDQAVEHAKEEHKHWSPRHIEDVEGEE